MASLRTKTRALSGGAEVRSEDREVLNRGGQRSDEHDCTAGFLLRPDHFADLGHADLVATALLDALNHVRAGGELHGSTLQLLHQAEFLQERLDVHTRRALTVYDGVGLKE